jgi:beta-galactosidase GanA
MLQLLLHALFVTVPTPGAFPSFADFEGLPYTVSYDARALTLSGQRALFLSGAMHPPRGSPEQWDGWFAQARRNGLNMVQVYVFWNFHQPTEDTLDWGGRANLTDFVQRAAKANLFVNLRIGPYVCAEWTYGGIPAWLGLKPGVRFRQSNPIWQTAMERWFNVVVGAMAKARLFATQGGPIVLVQVENELQPTDVAYVAWCGEMAARALKAASVNVPLTMCNGETANNTINTCNVCVRFAQRPALPPPTCHAQARPAFAC